MKKLIATSVETKIWYSIIETLKKDGLRVCKFVEMQFSLLREASIALIFFIAGLRNSKKIDGLRGV